jgi:adenylate cyclase class 2
MGTEFEVRKLEMSFKEMVDCVTLAGAKKLATYHQKRYVYDFNPPQKGRWIRLRSNGKETTLTIKEIKSKGIDGTHELEVVVSSFEDMHSILEKLGYKSRTFQENFRIEYELNGVKLDWDKWPMIPAFLEIEGDSQEAVLNMLSYLKINETDVTTADIESLYSEKYGINLNDIKHLRFSDEEISEIESIS